MILLQKSQTFTYLLLLLIFLMFIKAKLSLALDILQKIFNNIFEYIK